jgi:hypothetical protein
MSALCPSPLSPSHETQPFEGALWIVEEGRSHIFEPSDMPAKKKAAAKPPKTCRRDVHRSARAQAH